MALELAPEKITVNGVSPGSCATEINKPVLESAELLGLLPQRLA